MARPRRKNGQKAAVCVIINHCKNTARPLRRHPEHSPGLRGLSALPQPTRGGKMPPHQSAALTASPQGEANGAAESTTAAEKSLPLEGKVARRKP